MIIVCSCWYLLMPFDVCWYLLTRVYIYWYVLIFVEILFIFAYMNWHPLLLIHMYWYLLVFVDIYQYLQIVIRWCWFQLIFIDILLIWIWRVGGKRGYRFRVMGKSGSTGYAFCFSLCFYCLFYFSCVAKMCFAVKAQGKIKSIPQSIPLKI